MSFRLRFVAVAAMTAGLVLLSLAAAQASTLHGTVKNGTTGNPAAGVEVLLIQLLGGMETVANTKSDAQGQFAFDHPSIGQQPMLVRAVYRGVNFHQPLPPGQDTAVVEVFDSTRDISILSYPTRFVVFQPEGSSLQVGEEYAIQNNSKPPQAFFRADGSFQFELPDEAELKQVAAWGPSGMPVVQATIDRGQNKYAVAFAFRPGRSGVRLSYQLAYPGDDGLAVGLVHALHRTAKRTLARLKENQRSRLAVGILANTRSSERHLSRMDTLGKSSWKNSFPCATLVQPSQPA